MVDDTMDFSENELGSKKSSPMKHNRQKSKDMDFIKPNHLTIEVGDNDEIDNASNLDSAVMDTDRSIGGKKIQGFNSPDSKQLEDITQEAVKDPRKLSFATDRDGVMAKALKDGSSASKVLKGGNMSSMVRAGESIASHNESVLHSAQIRYNQAKGGLKTGRTVNTTGDEFDFKQDKSNLLMSVLDIDIEEVDDRLEGMEETIVNLQENQERNNIQIFNIVSIFLEIYKHSFLEYWCALCGEIYDSKSYLQVENCKSCQR